MNNDPSTLGIVDTRLLQSQVRRLKSRQHKAKSAYADFKTHVFSRRRAVSLCVGADLSAVVNGLCNHPQVLATKGSDLRRVMRGDKVLNAILIQCMAPMVGYRWHNFRVQLKVLLDAEDTSET